MEKTAKEQFLLNWDEGDTDNSPTKMERDLEKVIIEAQQQVKNLNIPNATLSLPSEQECLNMAYKFSLDIEPEKILTKEEENKTLFLNEGDVLPTEILFYEEHLTKLIRYCQGNVR